MNLKQPKNVIKIVLIIGLIAFIVFVGFKYKQFRTTKLEQIRVEQEKKTWDELTVKEQKEFDEFRARCETAKSVLDVKYENKLLSVNFDCVKIDDALQEISKKIGVKIVHPKIGLTIRVPRIFNNLTIKDGLNILGRHIGFSFFKASPDTELYLPRYLTDKNIWSFDKVIIEVKDPPKDRVTHIVETKDSLDFVKADGTNKSSYTNLTITKSSNERFILLYRYQKESTILNDQGELQWKTKIPDDLVNYQLSNNGKYIVADDEDPECANQCEIPISSYIINEKETIKINRSLTARGIIFSQDNNFFAGYSYPNKSFTVFDNHGNEISTKKTREEIKLIPGF